MDMSPKLDSAVRLFAIESTPQKTNQPEVPDRSYTLAREGIHDQQSAFGDPICPWFSGTKSLYFEPARESDGAEQLARSNLVEQVRIYPRQWRRCGSREHFFGDS